MKAINFLNKTVDGFDVMDNKERNNLVEEIIKFIK